MGASFLVSHALFDPSYYNDEFTAVSRVKAIHVYDFDNTCE